MGSLATDPTIHMMASSSTLPPTSDTTSEPQGKIEPQGKVIDVAVTNGPRAIKLRPVLKGQLAKNVKGKWVWEGKWGLDEKAFAPGGYLSPFHYERANATTDDNSSAETTTAASAVKSEYSRVAGVVHASQITNTSTAIPVESHNAESSGVSSVPSSPPTDTTEAGCDQTVAANHSANVDPMIAELGGVFNGFFLMGAATLGGKSTKHSERNIVMEFTRQDVIAQANTHADDESSAASADESSASNASPTAGNSNNNSAIAGGEEIRSTQDDPQTNDAQQTNNIKIGSASVSYLVCGKGKNQFGQFRLEGTYCPTSGMMELYRNYISLSPRARRAETRIHSKRSSTSIYKHNTTAAVTENGTAIPSAPHRTASSSSLLAGGGTQATSRCGRLRRVPSHLQDEDPALENSDVNRRMYQTLEAVTSADPNNWFLTPVDAAALGLDDYHVIVTQPMDLGTVRTRLGEGAYANATEFSNDVRLTFDNSMRYNPSTHPVHIAAAELLRLFERKHKELLKEPNNKKTQGSEPSSPSATSSTSSRGGAGKKPRGVAGKRPPKSGSAAPGKKRQRTTGKGKGGKGGKPGKGGRSAAPTVKDVQEQRRQIMQMNDDLAMYMASDDGDVIGEVGVHAAAVDVQQDGGVAMLLNPMEDVELSYEEKNQLGLFIHQLGPEDLQRVLDIITECGAMLPTNDEGELELDFDKIDAHALRCVQAFVWQCQAAEEKENE